MSWLIFSYRHQQIIARKSVLNFNLLNLQKRLMDLQSYASSIADGIVSADELSKAPASMAGRMFSFVQSSSIMAYNNARQNAPMVMAMNMPNIQATLQSVPPENRAQYQQYYQQMIFKNLFEQGRERSTEAEKAKLNAEEKKIDMQVAEIQNELTAFAAEEKTVTDAESKAAEASAPKYVA